jgi:hypothetical protein
VQEPRSPNQDSVPQPASKWEQFSERLFIGGIGLGVILLLVRISLPNYAGSRWPERNGCIANLKQITGAVDQWALENKKMVSDTYAFTPAVLAYMKGSVLPVCNQGGRYSPGKTIADPPRCSLSASHSHSL